MKPVTQKQLLRLRERMLHLLGKIQSTTQLEVRRTVCEFYYMQKVKEFEVLITHFNKVEPSLHDEPISLLYKEAFHRWKRDVRWVDKFLRSRSVL